MFFFKKISFILFAALCLTSCSQQPTYSFLLTHPKVLQNAFSHCDHAGTNDQQCEIIRKAANDFSIVVRERTDNAEKFGMRILTMQQELTKMAFSLDEWQKKLSADPKNKMLQEQLAKMKNAFADENQQLTVMLAVVAATSFEE